MIIFYFRSGVNPSSLKPHPVTGSRVDPACCCYHTLSISANLKLIFLKDLGFSGRRVPDLSASQSATSVIGPVNVASESMF